jgi:hypothetical protein
MNYATLKIFAAFAAAALTVAAAAATLGHTQQAKGISQSSSIICIDEECQVECLNTECQVYSSSDSPSTNDNMAVDVGDTGDMNERIEERLAANDDESNDLLSLFD